MKKFMLILLILLIFQALLYADVVYLKDGTKKEGKIVKETETEVKLRIRKKGIEAIITIKKSEIDKIVREKEDMKKTLSPKDYYKWKSERIEPGDAEAHFKLGIYMFESKLYEYAKIEFAKVIALGDKHKKECEKYLKEIEFLCEVCWGKGAVRCQKCKGTGSVLCDKCKGTGKVKCPKCGGTNEITCPECDGRGFVTHSVKGTTYRYRKQCPKCKGQKKIKCPDCKDGYVECPECSGKGKISCPVCKGKKEIPCPACEGTGRNKKVRPKEEPKEEPKEKPKEKSKEKPKERPKKQEPDEKKKPPLPLPPK